ncbi:unnamed protein product [Brassica rapa subsp. narinosa]
MGGVKLLFIFGLLILAMVAKSVKATYPLTKSCINGQGCIGDDDELESLMDSDTNRRQLARGRRYIGYDALKKNNVPCNRRGRSYYDCKKRRRNNPYRRGCSAITHCYRYANGYLSGRSCGWFVALSGAAHTVLVASRKWN